VVFTTRGFVSVVGSAEPPYRHSLSLIVPLLTKASRNEGLSIVNEVDDILGRVPAMPLYVIGHGLFSSHLMVATILRPEVSLPLLAAQVLIEPTTAPALLAILVLRTPASVKLDSMTSPPTSVNESPEAFAVIAPPALSSSDLRATAALAPSERRRITASAANVTFPCAVISDVPWSDRLVS
jgi:hypothetical protein